MSGCISIPLGDGGTLEVSKDGITVDEGKAINDSIEDEAEETEAVEAAELEVEPAETEFGIK